jgi:hypothetical protein
MNWSLPWPPILRHQCPYLIRFGGSGLISDAEAIQRDKDQHTAVEYRREDNRRMQFVAASLGNPVRRHLELSKCGAACLNVISFPR